MTVTGIIGERAVWFACHPARAASAAPVTS